MAKRKLEVEIIGDASSLAKALGKSGRDVQKFGKQAEGAHVRVRQSIGGVIGSAAKLAAVTTGIGGVAAGLTAVGRATVDFDKGMRNVNSIAQLNERQFGSLEKQVLRLAGKTAQAPKTLADGLYDLVSSGFKSKDAMLILASSAKAATAGLTDTGTSTKAVAAVLNAYHRPARAAADVSDTLFQTVNRGVISFEDLSTTIGDVLPFASALHVNLKQVGSAVATMTKEGISAPETMTRIKAVMETFIKPGENMAKAIKGTGAASGEALVKQKGFQGALEAVIKTTDGSKAAVGKLFPNIRALGGALALTGSNAKSAHGDLAAFRDVTGATDKALSQQSKSISYQWNQIKATVTSVAIQFGSVLIPAIGGGIKAVGRFIADMKSGTGIAGQIRSVATSAFNGIRDAVTGAVAQVRLLVRNFQDGKGAAVAIVATLAGLATAATVIKGIAMATRAWAAVQGSLNVVLAANPIGLAIASLAGLAVGLTITYKKSATFRNAVNSAWKGVKDAGKWLVQAGQDVAQWARNAVANVKRFASGVRQWIDNAVGTFKRLPGKVGDAFGSLVSTIGGYIGRVRSRVGKIASGAVEVLHGMGPRFVELGKNLIRGLINGVGALAGEVKDKIASVVTAPYNAAKEALGIHSPSRKFYWLGQMIGQGLSQGMRSTAGFVKDGAAAGLLFPLDNAIAELTAKRDKLQASFDAWDKKRSRAGLVDAIGAARSGGGDGSGGSSGSTSSSSNAGGVAAWAKSMVGHFAENTGKNTGRELDKLQATFGMRAQAWCAMFATTAADMGGASKAVRTASVATMRTWAQQGSHGYAKGVKKTAKAGDMAMFGGHHVAFVESVKGGKVHLLNGNGSDGKVSRRVISLEGDADYARPIYSGGHAAARKSGGGGAAARIFGFFKGQGFTDAQAAGFVGNMKQESGFNPGAVQKGGPGRGLVQWGGGRFTALQKFAKGRGTAWSNMDTQLAFVMKELHGGEKGAMHAVKGAKGTRMASAAVGLNYERYGVKGDRDKFSDEAFRRFGGKDITGHGATGKVSGKVKGGDGASIASAIKALHDFDAEAVRAKKLAAIDVQIRGLERVKAFKSAIADVRSQIQDKLGAAVDAFKTKWEATTGKARDTQFAQALSTFDQATEDAITNGPAAQALRDAQAEADRIAVAAEDASNQKALDDATAAGDADAIAAAQEGITKTARERMLTLLTSAAEDERNRITAERAATRKAMEDQEAVNRQAALDTAVATFTAAENAKLDVLTSALEAGRIKYAEYAAKVNAELAKIGGGAIAGTPEAEATINAGPAAIVAPARAKTTATRSGGVFGGLAATVGRVAGLGTVHRAVGGVMWPDQDYKVGELGTETVRVLTPSVATQASQVGAGGGGGVNINYYGPTTIGSQRAAEAQAHKLAHRLRFG